MDPSETLILIGNTFTRIPPTSQQLIDLLPKRYQLANPIPIASDIQTATDAQVPNLPPEPQLCDIQQYQLLQQIKDGFDNPNFTDARNRANPYENIGKSIFMNRAAIKIANVDAIYNLSNTFGGLLKPRTDGRFTFCDVAAGPGGFSQYIQYRQREGVGYGMTLRSPPHPIVNLIETRDYYGALTRIFESPENVAKVDAALTEATKETGRNVNVTINELHQLWETKNTAEIDKLLTGNLGYIIRDSLGRDYLDWNWPLLDMRRMNLIYGPDGTGNLYTNWKTFVQSVRSIEISGVDLVTADGGFDVEQVETGDPTKAGAEAAANFKRQEFLSSRLLLCQILIAISTLTEGGTFMVKLFDTVTSLSAQLLFILALSFNEITIFKPISSRPANAERYMVCKGLRKNALDYAPLLEQANNSYKDGINVTNILAGGLTSLPADYIAWLRELNQLSMDRQILASSRIVRLLAGENVEAEIPKYDLSKALIIWNLPDNTIGRRSLIRV